MLVLDLAHVANTLTLCCQHSYQSWADGYMHLGNCTGNAGRLRIRSQIYWHHFLHPISASCIIFLKAKELSALQCLDDLGRYKIPFRDAIVFLYFLSGDTFKGVNARGISSREHPPGVVS